MKRRLSKQGVYWEVTEVCAMESENIRLKVFLAEDEYIVREGIKNSIDWEGHGYIFCGDAGDGELALPIIRREKPDILVTDIRMPFMDGLELSRHVRQELPDTAIIILSGYEEFAYARDAIKIGVSEYLTKPISANDLLAGIDRVAEELRRHRVEEQLRAQYSREMQEDVQIAGRDLFRCLAAGGASGNELQQLMEKCNVSLSAETYNLVLLKLSSEEHEDMEFSDAMVRMDEAIEGQLTETGVLSFDRAPEGKAYLFMGESEEQVGAQIDAFRENVAELVKAYPGVSYFGAVGCCVDSLNAVHESYSVAGRAFSYRYFEKGNRFVQGSIHAESIVPLRGDFKVQDIDPKNMNRSELAHFLKTGSAEETAYFVDAFFDGFGEAVQSNMLRIYITMDAYFAVAEFMETIGRSKESVEVFNSNPDIIKTVEEAKGYITRILTAAINARDRLANNRYTAVVNEVYHYVRENYTNENLSLNQIAAYVNFSPSHLSMIFSQETGQTLIRYITDVRMEKAKELLRCSAKRSSEISTLVGYQDPHYFSYLFKKTQGVTPTDYRGGKQSEGED